MFGNFILAYQRKLGHTSVLLAEFWGVFEGLKLAWEYGCSCLLVQVDNSDIHDLLSSPSLDSTLPLVRGIADFMRKAWFVDVRLVPREANSAADMIAKVPSHDSSHQLIFNSPPECLLPILHRDYHGPPYSRLVN
ncbi:hypothetical protein GQ457_14G006590 [Hibiscus cannabinus]